jgi:25S rRNA (uracil2634-N3)-methyltransferase
LGRHSGLEVKRSWRFQREVWRGYRHARTLGVVKGGGGWKGEEREARMFEFVRKGEGVEQGKGKGKGGESSDEDEEDGGY